ncbi:Rap1a/Tai family immunity protein [Endozoicomonas euniceicola]|uniref:Rap1a/Tai family immunity protein n=1 Tax=Endozoicomonas euniceicola TaxID=1234143 RepID=A0ABY6GYV6_9GAMM|nr:Rap1a/Tai family immunity protein [Endozoicomonas euniceicola]UYM17089.1 Rap1a/Tai family immunity protein [Endozoicomonas euniceicola]
MRNSIKELFILAALAFTANVSADGTRFLEDCNNYAVSRGTFGQGYCIGVVVGVISASDKICLPENVTFKQAVLIVEKYLKDNPQELHFSEGSLAEYALSKTWACPK